MFLQNRKRTAYHASKDREFCRSLTIGMFDLHCRTLKQKSIMHTWDHREYVVIFGD
jgi:hypothetical protein